MGSIKKGLNRFFSYLDDSSIPIRDRTYVLFSLTYFGAMIASAIVGIFLQESVSSTLSSFGIIIVSTVFLLWIVKKNKIRAAKLIIAFLMVFFFQPVMFFTKGGLSAGSLFTILLGTYYLVLVLEGRFRVVMCLVDLVVLVACWITAYLRPDLVTEYTREADFIYSFAKYVIMAMVLTVVITFQTRVYQKEAKMAEEKAKELEESNRAQNRFFSSMSHEIRTPINTVLGLNEVILRQEDASDEIIKDARNIQGAGKMLLALINDILDVSKIEAGKMEIVPVEYKVSTLVSEIVNMIWLKADEKGLVFNVDIDPSIPAILFGDEVRVKQVLINLLNNAVKYTKEGSVTLHMESEALGEDSIMLLISVSDTGMGIKQEALPHLFDSFQRVDEEKNRHIEGTGLGLSIVKQLVELMGGEITVNSVYTEGSIFTVTLKQRVADGQAIGDLSIASAGAVNREKFQHSFKAPEAKILIVDDNEMNLQVEAKLLDGTEMAVELVTSGAEALERTVHERYDVIFMDHLMPEMDGIKCFEEIKRQTGGLNRDVPVIVLTANAGGENRELYSSTGFDGYLVKPVSGAQLEEMLIRHIPEEKLILNENHELTKGQKSTARGYSRKRAISICTSSMSDIPQSLIKSGAVGILNFSLHTNEGMFWDGLEADSDEIIRYMLKEGNTVVSYPPSEEEFVHFFSTQLREAHQVLYIAITSDMSKELEHASAAAKNFENVTVLDSGSLSSATGMLVLTAYRLASRNMTMDKIVKELESVRDRIHCSFVIADTEFMTKHRFITPKVNKILKALSLRPALRVKNNKFGVWRILLGRKKDCYEKYIRMALPQSGNPDRDLLFITYADVKEERLNWIAELAQKRVQFDNIVFVKASAAISSNCGPGTFGLLYMDSGPTQYNLSALIPKEVDEEEIINEESTAAVIEEKKEPQPAHEGPKSDVSQEPQNEVKWYETIPGIDPAAALKNSGSEESFLMVVKIYYDTYDNISAEIQGYYDAKDWEYYTIKVHALKSSSRLVGAVQLGSDAEALEMAGKSGDIDFINSHHDALMKDYKAIIEELKPILGAKEDLPEVPSEVLEDAYGGLAEFAENMDYDLSCMIMDSLKEYRLPPEDEERFSRIQAKLSVMDWDGIKAIVHEIM